MLQGHSAQAPELLRLGFQARELQLLKPMCFRAHTPQQEKSQWREAYASQPEKACMQQQRFGVAKNK